MKGLEDVGVQVYEQFAINVAILFGANESIAEKEIREMIDFEIKLANVSHFQVTFLPIILIKWFNFILLKLWFDAKARVCLYLVIVFWFNYLFFMKHMR